MKKILLILIVASLTKANAQDTAKNYCSIGLQCHEEIMVYLQGFFLDKIDSTTYSQKTIYAYKNSDDDKLQFVYNRYLKGYDADLKIKGIKVYELESIVTQYLTAYKIYTDYFGGNKTIEDIKTNGLFWNYKYGKHKKTLSMTSLGKSNGNAGYWMMRF